MERKATHMYGYALHDADTGDSIRSTDIDELREWAVAHSNGKSHHTILGLIDPDEIIADGTFEVLTLLARQNTGIAVERFSA